MTTVDPITSQDLQPKNDPAQPMFSNEDKRDELAREIHMRKSLYPSFVRQGKLTQQQADRHLAIITAVWAEYRDKAAADKKQREPELSFETPPEPAP